VEKSRWTWMPHAGHYIRGGECRFRLCTCVGRYIVSTVGELPSRADAREFEPVGCGRLYETMVFRAVKSKNGCCPYEMETPSEVDFRGYNDPRKARIGHMELCRKWAREGK